MQTTRQKQSVTLMDNTFGFRSSIRSLQAEAAVAVTASLLCLLVPVATVTQVISRIWRGFTRNYTL